MPEAPPEADLPLAEDHPSAEAAGYLPFPPHPSPLPPLGGEGTCVVTPWQDHGEFLRLKILNFNS